MSTTLDETLQRLATGKLFHAEGPPLQSVTRVPIGSDELHVTSGLFPDTGYELSLRVPTYPGGGPGWAPPFLRMLARYVLTSKRELKLGAYFPFFKPISRVALPPAERTSVPHTEMDSVAFTLDPTLPFIETPQGKLELRRVVGLFPDERERIEAWSVEGVLGLFAQRGQELNTDIGRSSYTRDPAFIAACEEGSAREGATAGHLAVEGIGWDKHPTEYVVHFPGGHDAQRILRMVKARLGHGKHLLIHDVDPDQKRTVVLTVGPQLKVKEQGNDLLLQLPLDFPLFAELGEAPFEATFETGGQV